MNSEEIAALIRATGMKQTEIAVELEVNVSTVRRWAAGNSTPSDEHIGQLQKLAGQRPKLRPLGSRKPVTGAIAELPSEVLIEELARRARGGTLRDTGAARLDAPRPLRAVAFTDVADD